MPTEWLQDRTNGSKTAPGMPPQRALCGSHDGKDTWRDGRSDRECRLATASRRGGEERMAAEEEAEETAKPKANSQRSRPWMVEATEKMRCYSRGFPESKP
jgi:hypothetical protein